MYKFNFLHGRPLRAAALHVMHVAALHDTAETDLEFATDLKTFPGVRSIIGTFS